MEKKIMEKEENLQKQEPDFSPLDIFTLYMRNKLDMSKTGTSYEKYMCYLTSIDLGSSMLGPNHNSLKEMAREVLKDESLIPKSSDIEYVLNEDSYHIGKPSSSKRTDVKSTDVKLGIEQDINKQCDSIIPVLKILEKDIFDALIEEKVIPAKNLNLIDLAMEKIKSRKFEPNVKN